MKHIIYSALFIVFLASCSVGVTHIIKKDEAVQVGLVKEPYQDRKTTYTISLKLLDIETAQIIASSTEETKTSTTFKANCEKLVPDLLKNIKVNEKKKERIAVMTTKNTDFDKKLMAHVETEIVNKNKFILVERSQIDKILKEQQFSNSDLVDEGKAAQVGKLLGITKTILINLLETRN